ncbi:MAG TPA: hypothetical protein VN721_08425 [Flavipsychrobacter sp.]|nr:hypothetical protein [Flavipsychrobacter sp.]
MYIKDQIFKDEDTLLEMLFDFSLGTSSSLIQQMIADIDNDLLGNDAYIKYRDSLQDEDDRTELYTEERDLRLAEKLMQQFGSFAISNSKLYGIKKDGKELLYEIDLY